MGRFIMNAALFLKLRYCHTKASGRNSAAAKMPTNNNVPHFQDIYSVLDHREAV